MEVSHATQYRQPCGIQDILIATDFSEVSQHALLHALAMAKRFDTKLTVVSVAPRRRRLPF